MSGVVNPSNPISNTDLLRESLVAHVRLTEEKFDARDKALESQAKEYHRRLEALNGEAARLREMQTHYLPRETYESDKRMLMVLTVGVVSALLSSLVAIILTALK